MDHPARALWRPTLIATAVLLTGVACEKSAGGLGLGFADSPVPLRAPVLGLQFDRLYLPEGTAAGTAFVAVCNRSGADLDVASSNFLLMGSAGQAPLSPNSPWDANACVAVTGDDLAALGLHGQAGELALVRDGAFFEAYAAWGAASGAWPSQFAQVARRLGLSAEAVRPLPLALQAGQAIALAGATSTEACASADQSLATADTLAACLAADDNELTDGIALSRVVAGGSDPGGSVLELINRDPAAAHSACGLTVCTTAGCALIACTSPADGTLAPVGQGAASRLRLPLAGSASQGGDLPLPLAPLRQNDVVALLAPGDTNASPAPRLLGYVQLTPTPFTPAGSAFFAAGAPAALAAWANAAIYAPRLAGESCALDANQADPLAPSAWSLRAVLPGGEDDGSDAYVACSAPVAPRTPTLVVGGVEAASSTQLVVALRNATQAPLSLAPFALAVGDASVPLDATATLAPGGTWRIGVATADAIASTAADQLWNINKPVAFGGECSVLAQADGSVVAHLQWQAPAPLADSRGTQAALAGAWPQARCRQSRFVAAPGTRLLLRTDPLLPGQSPADYALGLRQSTD